MHTIHAGLRMLILGLSNDLRDMCTLNIPRMYTQPCSQVHFALAIWKSPDVIAPPSCRRKLASGNWHAVTFDGRLLIMPGAREFDTVTGVTAFWGPPVLGTLLVRMHTDPGSPFYTGRYMGPPSPIYRYIRDPGSPFYR